MNESDNRASVPATNVEPPAGDESVGAQALPRFDTPVAIRVTSYRKNKHDTDGLSVKAVLDGVVRAGILADDSAKQVTQITFESVKSSDERTVIEIIANGQHGR